MRRWACASAPPGGWSSSRWARGSPRRAGRLLAIVVEAQAAGTWARLKACPAEDCHWAFYDASRNRSRTWCSMQGCGNRAKARAYRARHYTA